MPTLPTLPTLPAPAPTPTPYLVTSPTTCRFRLGTTVDVDERSVHVNGVGGTIGLSASEAKLSDEELTRAGIGGGVGPGYNDSSAAKPANQLVNATISTPATATRGPNFRVPCRFVDGKVSEFSV